MTTYELETGTIGFIEVPNDAEQFEIELGSDLYYKKPFLGVLTTHLRELTSGNWQPLSLFSQLKEEDVKDVMPRQVDWGYVLDYVDFQDQYTVGGLPTAIEAIHSLAKHLGLTTKNNFIKPDIQYYLSDSCFTMADYERDMQQWQQAQSKVKQYFVVFKAKQ